LKGLPPFFLFKKALNKPLFVVYIDLLFSDLTPPLMEIKMKGYEPKKGFKVFPFLNSLKFLEKAQHKVCFISSLSWIVKKIGKFF